MMTNDNPPKQLILLGGGHTHALVILDLIQNRYPNTDITLISPDRFTPYSGMLPGLIAGHYNYQDIHINLVELCNRANIRFLEQRALSLNADQQIITLDNHSQIPYDILSIDIGITPDTQDIKGADKYSFSVKPVAEFYAKLNALRKEMKANKQASIITVIGGGAGSIEIIFALACALRQEFSNKQLTFKLVTSGDNILLTHPEKVRLWIRQLLSTENIELITQCQIREITQTHLIGKTTNPDSNKAELIIESTHNILCTAGKAAEWLQDSGLKLDNGFISVDLHLRSLSHYNVFATGDCMNLVPVPLPKAGVFAVRQAPILVNNLRNTLNKKPLTGYKPQCNFLTLMALGKKYAIGSRGELLCLRGKWVWHLKDFIDRRFINRFK